MKKVDYPQKAEPLSFTSKYIHEYRCLRCGAIVCENNACTHSHICLDGTIGYLQAIGKRQIKVKGTK